MNEKDEQFYLNLQSRLLKRRDLNPIDKLIWSYLDFRQGVNDDCWPGNRRISLDLGVSRQTVIDSIKRLSSAGEIKVKQSKGGKNADGQPATNHYVTVKNIDSIEGNQLSRNRDLPSKKAKSTVQKSCSTVKNLDTKTNTKTNTEKEKKTKNYSSLSISLVSELVEQHIRLSPAAQPKHQKGLLVKCQKLLEQYDAQDVKDTIERYSSKGTKGDGWGIILKMIPMIENVRAEETYQANLVADQQAKAEREKQPVPDMVRQVAANLTDLTRPTIDERKAYLREQVRAIKAGEI